LRALFDLPLSELIYRAQSIHRENFDAAAVQISTLLSIKTGGCPEDCAHCPQSAQYDTGVRAERLMPLDAVLAQARAAREAGASRFEAQTTADKPGGGIACTPAICGFQSQIGVGWLFGYDFGPVAMQV